MFLTQGSCAVSPEGAIHSFYNDLRPTSEAQAWASKIKSASFNVLVSKVQQTAHEQPAFHSRISYIHCKKDVAIPFDMQKRLVAAAGIQRVAILDTDHSPFLTMPKDTAQIVIEHIDGFV